MLYGVWINNKDGKGRLERVPAESQIALEQELGKMELISWHLEFQAETEAEYKRKEANWRKRTSLDSYSGSDKLPS